MKKFGLALVAVAAIAIGGLSLAATGLYQNFPLLGNTVNTNTPPGPTYSTTCTSFGNNGVCNQYQPLGPKYLQGTESFLADTNYSSQNPVDIAIPLSLMTNGFGGATVNTTTGTGQAIVVADAISNYIYAGAGTATFSSITMPPNPATNQKFCIVDAGTGVLTLTSVAAGVNSFGNTPTITGTAPTSIPVATAVGTAGTVTLSSDCWLYVAGASNTGVWYRTQ